MKKKSNDEHGFIIIKSREVVDVEERLGNLADLIVRITTRLETEYTQTLEESLEKYPKEQ